MRAKHIVALAGLTLLVALAAGLVVALLGQTPFTALLVVGVVIVAALIGLLIGYGMRLGRKAIRNIKRNGL